MIGHCVPLKLNVEVLMMSIIKKSRIILILQWYNTNIHCDIGKPNFTKVKIGFDLGQAKYRLVVGISHRNFKLIDSAVNSSGEILHGFIQ